MISNCIMSPVHLKSERITPFRKELALIKHFIITNRRIHNQCWPLIFVFPQFINLSGLKQETYIIHKIKSTQNNKQTRELYGCGSTRPRNCHAVLADDVRPRPVSRGSGQGAPHPPEFWIQRNVRSFLWYCRRSYGRLNVFSQHAADAPDSHWSWKNVACAMRFLNCSFGLKSTSERRFDSLWAALLTVWPCLCRRL